SGTVQAVLLALTLAPDARGAPLRWEGWPGDPAQVALMDGRRQLGVWVVAERAYYPRQGGGWGAACEPPIAPPRAPCGCDQTCPCVGGECGCNRLSGRCGREGHCGEDAGAAADWVTRGVETDKVGRGPTYLRGGGAISRAQAFEAVQGKGIPDDARRLRVTVIGAEAARGPVLRDLDSHPALSALKG